MSFSEQVVLGRSIREGLNAISHATAGAGSEVAYSIDGLAKATKEAAKINAAAIKQAGYQIAQGAITSASIMCQGLAKISDEMEQRRKQEEYYLLLKQIDETEDKILKLHGDLRAIYDNMDFSDIPEVFELGLPEILVILELFDEAEPYDWLVSTSRLTLSNPFSLLCAVFASYGLKLKAKKDGYGWPVISLHVGDKLRLGKFEDEGTLVCLNAKVYASSSNTIEIIFDLPDLPGMTKITKDITSHFGPTREKVYFNGKTGYYVAERMLYADMKELDIPLDSEDLIGIIAELLKKHERTTLCDLCADRVSDVSNLKALEAQINCEIILSQLRYIDDMLRKAYRDLKLK